MQLSLPGLESIVTCPKHGDRHLTPIDLQEQQQDFETPFVCPVCGHAAKWKWEDVPPEVRRLQLELAPRNAQAQSAATHAW